VQYIIDPERISALGGADLANPYARFTPAASASAQDFSFNPKSAFSPVDGNPDGDSTQYGASVSDVAIAISTGERDDPRNPNKKDKDGIGWDDVVEAGERLQEEKRRLSVGAISFTADEVDAIRSIANDPEKLARANQALQDKGYTQEQADFGLHWAMIAAEIAYKEENGTSLTAEEQAQKQELEEMTPEQTAIIQDAGRTMAKVANASSDLTVGAVVQSQDRANAQGDEQTVVANASTGDVVSDDATATNIADERVWEAARAAQGLDAADIELAAQARSDNDVGSMAFLGDDPREGPLISSEYNSSATGTPQMAQTLAPEGQTSNVEFGLG